MSPNFAEHARKVPDKSPEAGEGSMYSTDSMSLEGHGLSKLAATMALVSTLVGGAIVSMPHAFYYTGIPLGTILLCIFAC